MSNPTEIPFGQGGARVPSSLVQKGLQFANNMGLDALTALVKNLIEQQMPAPYVLPTASAETLGGVKVGEGLQISEEGVLSSSGGGNEAGGITISLGSLSEPKHINLPDNIADSVTGIVTSVSGNFRYSQKISDVGLSLPLYGEEGKTVKELVDQTIPSQLPEITTLSDNVKYFGDLSIENKEVISYSIVVMVQDTSDPTLWHYALIDL